MVKFEIFSADCPLCRSTTKVLRSAIDKRKCGCEIKEHRCSGDLCCEPAQKYGVNVVPTVVRDGKVVHIGKLTTQEAAALLPV